jgi:hypothetical protein
MTRSLAYAPLTVFDRCDRCGAAAITRAVLPSGGELLFCGHHTRQHQVRLQELAAELLEG